MIEDLLDVSRIVTGKVALEILPVNPQRVVEAALETMQPAAQTKGITVVPLLDIGVATVRGDFAHLPEKQGGIDVSDLVRSLRRDSV